MKNGETKFIGVKKDIDVERLKEVNIKLMI